MAGGLPLVLLAQYVVAALAETTKSSSILVSSVFAANLLRIVLAKVASGIREYSECNLFGLFSQGLSESHPRMSKFAFCRLGWAGIIGTMTPSAAANGSGNHGESKFDVKYLVCFDHDSRGEGTAVRLCFGSIFSVNRHSGHQSSLEDLIRTFR